MSEHTLNLDELFGQARPVVVLYGNHRYELRRPEGLTPVEYSRWSKLQARINQLNLTEGTDVTDEETAAQLERVVDDAITLLCPALGEAGLMFAAKMRVLEFYVREVEKAPASGDADPNPTGA